MDNYRSGALIPVSALKDFIAPSAGRIVDVRAAEDYAASHVKNAVSIHRDEFSADQGKIIHMAADRLSLQAVLSKNGIEASTPIIIYDDRGGVTACRLWWLLKLYGHQKVSVVDGGWHSIKKEDIPLEVHIFRPSPSAYAFPPAQGEGGYAYLHDVLAAEPSSLLDVRTPEERSGEITMEGAFAPGWIPGSKYHYYEEFLSPKEEGYTFLPYNVLKAKAESLGLSPEKPCIVYCQAGFRAAHTFFVLKELLGFEDVKNYDGSWIEYSSTKLPKGL